MLKIDTLFQYLIEKKGSDLHLEQGQVPKIRLNGELVAMENQEALTQKNLIDLLKEMARPEDWSIFEGRGDLDFAYALGQEARFRANFFRHFAGYGAIFRLIPSRIVTLEELNAPEVFKKFASLRSGLVLITGPTGSGKSTTLAAILNYINENFSHKIITIEEPVEFMHQNKKSLIVHREVGLDTASFASGLKSALKSDVNIILVGEMRDRETVELALTAAEKGILVFGTLHTNSAAKTIDRIIDVFPTNKKNQVRTLLANALKGIVAQQLLKSVDKSRRWAAYEILLETQSLGAIIRSGETVKLISEIQLNRASGMILMDDHLSQLIEEDKINKEEAYLKAFDKSRFV